MLKLLILVSLLFFSTALGFKSLPRPFIVGGNNATRGQFKYFASLRYRLGAVEVHGCGTNILNTRWSLTAAHCVDFDLSSIDGIDMVAGSVSLSDPGARYNIAEVVKHPAYLLLDLSSVGIYWVLNDVCLLKTDRPIEFNEYIQPIAIERGHVRRNSDAIFAGHGATEHPDPDLIMSEYLQYVHLRTLSEIECRNRVTMLYLRGQIPFLPFVMDKICTVAAEQQGICFGDSGSGLVVDGKLVGVASFILAACPSQVPEFFARVSSFANWIDSHINNL